MTDHIAAEIALQGERGYPHEICGLLLGRWASDDERLVVEVFQLDNERLDAQSNRYAASARSMMIGERRASQAGLDVVGYYHSHPNAPAVPSGYDLDHATWPGVSYPIVSVRDGVAGDLRSWTLADDRSEFVEEPVTREN